MNKFKNPKRVVFYDEVKCLTALFLTILSVFFSVLWFYFYKNGLFNINFSIFYSALTVYVIIANYKIVLVLRISIIDFNSRMAIFIDKRKKRCILLEEFDSIIIESDYKTDGIVVYRLYLKSLSGNSRLFAITLNAKKIINIITLLKQKCGYVVINNTFLEFR